MLATALFVAMTTTLGGREATRPNFIVILTDDQGYAEMSCHGNPLLQTPHLDRLHAEGVCFKDFQVSPTCSPTRAALLTGRHEFKSGVTHTIFERERLSRKAVTLADVLHRAGYTTGIFGKWHLGDEKPYQPERRGFDEVFIHGGGGIGQTYPGSCGDAPGNTYFDPYILHNGRFVKTRGYCTDVFFREAMRWIGERARKPRCPFFAFITPNAPHSPYISPGPQYEAPFSGKGLNPDAVAYYAMIANIDDNVGRLLAGLREWELETNTLVVFLTDNGHSLNLYNAGMRDAKASPYQGGIRTASLWRWPGTLPAGQTVNQLAAHVDVLPTFAELAGIKLSGKVAAQVEGRSLVPLLQSPAAEWPDRLLFTHLGRWAHGKVAEAKYRRCAVRNQRFKLINHEELYDLANDPGETTNVAAQFPEVVASLRAAYDQWWEEILPCLENEDAMGPKINPFKERFWKQFGGGPTPELLQQMDPARKFAASAM